MKERLIHQKKKHNYLVVNLPLNHSALVDEEMKQGMIMRKKAFNTHRKKESPLFNG